MFFGHQERHDFTSDEGVRKRIPGRCDNYADNFMERINRVTDMRGATAHIFGHSFVAMLNDAGASIKTIQPIIGQSDFKTMAGRYATPATASGKRRAVLPRVAINPFQGTKMSIQS